MKTGTLPSLCTCRHHRHSINFSATQGCLFLMSVLLGRDPEVESDTLVTVDLTC